MMGLNSITGKVLFCDLGLPNIYEASGRAVKLLREDLEGIKTQLGTISSEIGEINQRLKVMSDRLTEIEKAVAVIHKSVAK